MYRVGAKDDSMYHEKRKKKNLPNVCGVEVNERLHAVTNQASNLVPTR